MNFKFNIKSSDFLTNALEKVKKELQEDLQQSIRTLGKGALEEAQRVANDRLPDSLKTIYQDNLYFEEISDNMVVVGLREEASWIENGRKSGFMEELLTAKSGSPVKVSKDGDRYRVIPFEHSTKTNENASSSKQQMVSELKSFLRSKGIGYSKTRGLALDSNGSPRVGKIASFSLKDNRKLSANLKGLSIHQNFNPRTNRVERNIMTFRVISDKHKDSGKWNHPGRNAENILEDAYKWVENTWQNDIFPELKRKYEGK
jgi:hypothetical protein